MLDFFDSQYINIFQPAADSEDQRTQEPWTKSGEFRDHSGTSTAL